ncbi:MAG: tetratricopeptide repeat protein [Sphingomonadales bacterium]|nr:tetratricopeptide repeat protein [Sphingomonadales bacterium]
MNSRPLLLLTLCLLLGTTLWVWGERSTLKPNGESDSTDQSNTAEVPVDTRGILSSKIQSLEQEDRSKFLQVQASLDSLADRKVQAAGVWKSLSSFWLTREDMLGAALCLDLASELHPTSDDFRDAGLYYGSAVHSLQEGDSAIAAFCRNKATALLAKALENKPGDLDLKADWAHALVQSSPAPMQGVQALMEITRVEPKHLKAHTHLAKLAIESGQFPKAIARFKNLLEWYPGLGSTYLGLGEAYFRNGNKDSAVIYLQQYRGLVQDPETQQQIDSYLRQINP